MNAGQLDSRTPSQEGSGSYPRFYPHITLASLPLSAENSLTDIETAIASSLKAPLTVKFRSVDIGSHYFRSVYLAIDSTSEIMDLHGRIHEALQAVPQTPSFPHLSLCYIDDEDAAAGERERFYKTLKDGGKIKAGGEGGVDLNCGLVEEEWMDRFEATEVWVVRCDGPVNKWAKLLTCHIVV